MFKSNFWEVVKIVFWVIVVLEVGGALMWLASVALGNPWPNPDGYYFGQVTISLLRWVF